VYNRLSIPTRISDAAMNILRFKGYTPAIRWFRLLYKLCLPAGKRHYSATFPSLSLDAAHSCVYWNRKSVGILEPWSDFPNRGRELLIIGSGPSVIEQLDAIDKISSMQQVDMVLLNGAATLVNDGLVSNPLAIIIEDGRFVLEKFTVLQSLPGGTRLILSASALHALIYCDKSMLQYFDVWFMDSIQFPYRQPKRPLGEVLGPDVRIDGNMGLSLNLAKGHFGCGTVMYAGIQLAFHLRSPRVLLAGFDLTNYQMPRFYETEANAAWTGVDNAYEKRILPALKLAKECALEFAMEIENCSHTSIVPRNLIPFSSRLMPASWDGRFQGQGAVDTEVGK